jgi:hypothetical protein
MPGMMGFNPYGGYGQPQMMPQAAQMAAQQAYAQQMQSIPQMMPQAQPGVTVRLVTSRDEATTAQIPFDATINVFVNMSAGEIYIKRFNPQTGGAWFADYVPKTQGEAKPAEEPAAEYVTLDRFGALEARVSELAESIAMRRRSARNDE